MSFKIFENDSYCVEGRHRSFTKNIYGDITSKGSKVLIGYCPICNRKKSVSVIDNTKQAEGLRDFFKILGKRGLIVSKKMAKKVLKNPSRALNITANSATAAASRNSKNEMKTLPELITFHNTSKNYYLGKFA